MKEVVEIAEYDPRWPSLYDEERKRILDALGDLAVGVEHAGSTAVPGLGAKPIIDIMVAVRTLSDVEHCIQPLEGLGYEYRGEAGVPGRLFFRKFTGGVRTHHLHIVERSGEQWERNVLFRDYLRLHPDVAGQYYELKKRLAKEFGVDPEGYLAGKAEFIESVLARARATTTSEV